MAKRKRLSKREIKEFNEKIKQYNIEFSKKDAIDLVDDKCYLIKNQISFFIYKENIIPTLKFILQNEIKMKEVIVDMGAIKFITSGSDIMAPGIKEKDQFKEEEIILIKDEKNKKPLVIGEALDNSENIINKGRCIKNIHYIGDEIWNYEI